MFPIAPVAFAVWIWSLIPQTEAKGVAAMIFVSLLITMPWLWHAIQCAYELRRRSKDEKEV